jgi:membrane-associated phospholipid phosphatase
LSRPGRLRASEWIYLTYFCYVAVLALILPLAPAVRWRPAWVLAGSASALFILSRLSVPHIRDWIPLLLTLVAYREMDWFTPAHKAGHLERAWVQWDRYLLNDLHVRALIESLGPFIPGYLELCYVLVYGVGAYCLIVLYAEHRPERVDAFLCVYALGGLLSYALFPFFPSDPPRTVFAGADLPVMTPIRQLNLWLVNDYGIHSSVFPSAHVSTGFAAAWGLRHALPERPWFGWGLFLYAVSMSVATVYGRYHYAVDALAGFAVSLAAIGLVKLLRIRI